MPRIKYELANELEIPVNELTNVRIRVPQEEQSAGYLFLASESVMEEEGLKNTLHQKIVTLTVDCHLTILRDFLNIK